MRRRSRGLTQTSQDLYRVRRVFTVRYQGRYRSETSVHTHFLLSWLRQSTDGYYLRVTTVLPDSIGKSQWCSEIKATCRFVSSDLLIRTALFRDAGGTFCRGRVERLQISVSRHTADMSIVFHEWLANPKGFQRGSLGTCIRLLTGTGGLILRSWLRGSRFRGSQFCWFCSPKNRTKAGYLGDFIVYFPACLIQVGWPTVRYKGGFCMD